MFSGFASYLKIGDFGKILETYLWSPPQILNSSELLFWDF